MHGATASQRIPALARQAAGQRRWRRRGGSSWLCIGAIARCFLGLFLLRAAGGRVRRGPAQGRWRLLRKLPRPGGAVGAIKLTLLTAGIAVPLNLVFGLAAVVGHRQVQLPRQEPADHAHRPAVRRFAGDLRA